MDKVIARVDFASDLPIKESLAEVVAREVVKRFPISEPKKAFLGKVEFSINLYSKQRSYGIPRVVQGATRPEITHRFSVSPQNCLLIRETAHWARGK